MPNHHVTDDTPAADKGLENKKPDNETPEPEALGLDGRDVLSGDRLYCQAYGWGTVVKVEPGLLYGITLGLDGGSRQCYSEDGKIATSGGRVLFWDVPTFTAPPLPPRTAEKIQYVYTLMGENIARISDPLGSDEELLSSIPNIERFTPVEFSRRRIPVNGNNG